MRAILSARALRSRFTMQRQVLLVPAEGLDPRTGDFNSLFTHIPQLQHDTPREFSWLLWSGVVACQGGLSESVPRGQPPNAASTAQCHFAVQALASASTRVYTTLGEIQNPAVAFSRRPEGGLRRNYVRNVLGRIGNTCILRNPDRAFARRLGTCLPAPH
jgi:hypothetical protein